tara:strand:- start:941 stop:1219 length:279 start_codon:yes stop_codon:yes gene_type:complete
VKKEKHEQPRLYTFRVKYNAGAGHEANDSFHYFKAISADQALDFHFAMMERNNFISQTISVERKDPYADKWVLEESKKNNKWTNITENCFKQ